MHGIVFIPRGSARTRTSDGNTKGVSLTTCSTNTFVRTPSPPFFFFVNPLVSQSLTRTRTNTLLFVLYDNTTQRYGCVRPSNPSFPPCTPLPMTPIARAHRPQSHTVTNKIPLFFSEKTSTRAAFEIHSCPACGASQCTSHRLLRYADPFLIIHGSISTKRRMQRQTCLSSLLSIVRWFDLETQSSSRPVPGRRFEI
jgi:hypothetical protein